jgi:hypothetical protein
MIPQSTRLQKHTHLRMKYECDVVIELERGLKQSEDQNIIIPSQVRRRKQRSSQFSIHIKICQLEISRLSCKEYGQINYDAKACYDRILPKIAAMSSLVHGVPGPGAGL